MADRQEQDEFLLSVEDLEKELEELRVGKLSFAVEQFKNRLFEQQEKQRRIFKQQLSIQMNESISSVAKETGERKGKLDKLIEDINKQKSTYLMLLQDLQSKKVEIENSYDQIVMGLRQFKDRQQTEWKKKAQEFLVKHKLT